MWRRRKAANLKVGDIISPEWNWGARILKVYRPFGSNNIGVICDPHGVIELYVHPDAMQSDIVGPHLFGPNQRPFVWTGEGGPETWGMGLR